MDSAREIDHLLSLNGVMAPATEATDAPIIDLDLVQDVIFSGDDIWSTSDVTYQGSPTLEYDNDKLVESEFLQAPSVEVQPANLDLVAFNTDSNFSGPTFLEDFNQFLMAEPLSSTTEPLSTQTASLTSDTDGSCIVVQAMQQSLGDSLMNQVNQVDTSAPSPTPNQVVNEVKPKKRGRKPKSESGLTRRELRRQRKVKVYEMPPLEDEEAEKKRKNALNAKRHRDLAKKKMADVEQSLADVIAERDQLRLEVQRLRQSEGNLRQLLNQRQCAFVLS